MHLSTVSVCRSNKSFVIKTLFYNFKNVFKNAYKK